MRSSERLLAHYENITDAPDAIAHLRCFILTLAVRGRLLPQDANDEPAPELLERVGTLPAPPRYAKRSPELIPSDCGLSINKPNTPVPAQWIWVPLVAVGRDRSEDLARPEVTQLLWAETLAFIWDRFHRYRQQKTQVDQWDAEGRKIKRLADEHRRLCEDFVERALDQMGVRND